MAHGSPPVPPCHPGWVRTDRHIVFLCVKQELDLPEARVVDDVRGRHIIEQPWVVVLKLKGAKGEGLAHRELVGLFGSLPLIRSPPNVARVQRVNR